MPDRLARLDLRVSPASLLAFLGLATTLLASAGTATAQTPTVNLGGGIQSSFFVNSPEDDDATGRFLLNSARLYISGTAAPKTKFMFNTEYTGNPGVLGILDAAAQFEFSPKLNIWAGRFLPPSDRANLYGPYYSSHWSTFTDGVQDGYPFAYVGRDNGVMYWGQFNKVKVSGGAFDGPTTTGDTTVLLAERVQVDFWDAEDGYYLNGTYYGAKNLLAIGAAAQQQGTDRNAYNVDFLLERKVGTGGAVTLEAEWARYDQLGGYNPNYSESDGGYVLAAYLFPKVTAAGKLQILGKFAHANFTQGATVLFPDYDQTTTEINFNLLPKDFNSRVMFFFKNTDFSAVQQSFMQVGVGFQLQIP